MWLRLDGMGGRWACLPSLSQVNMLAGRTASPEFLRMLTYLTYNHDENIVKVAAHVLCMSFVQCSCHLSFYPI